MNSTPSRRIDDSRDSAQLQWDADDLQRAKESSRLANAMAASAAAFLSHMDTGGALAALPDTNPQQYVVAGTLAMIGKVLGERSEVAPAAATVLTDERINSLWSDAAVESIKKAGVGIGNGDVAYMLRPEIFARSIEREVLAHAGAAVKRVAELEAARIAYASEFPLTADGEPDVGSIHANIRKLKAALAHAGVAAKPAVARDGWMVDGSLIYRLNDHGVNCDEINVTMVNGSRANEARHDAATELLAELLTIPAQAPAEEVRAAEWIEIGSKLPKNHQSVWVTHRTEYVNAPTNFSVMGAIFVNGKWRDANSENDLRTPTHWMSRDRPIPAIAHQSTANSGDSSDLGKGADHA